MRLKCCFKTYHEYRVSVGVIGVIAVLTGLIDALTEDFTVKAFLWSAVFVSGMFIISYEFIVMERPERPLLQAFLFIVTALCGIIGIHHYVWYFTSILVERVILSELWLAPGIYTDFTLYMLISAICVTIYVAYLIYVNTCVHEV